MNQQLTRFTLLHVILLILATYGIFYFSYKYYVPWPDQNDYHQYYSMYRQPLDITQAESPFIYRQLSALVTHSIYRLGIFYPNEIQFVSSDYDQRMFFAVLFSNYIALLLTAIFTGKIVVRLTKKSSLLPPLLAGLLCFTAFFALKGVMTEMTEGWSWCLMAIGFYGYLHHRLWIVMPILFLAIFQRETIPLIFGVFAAIDSILAYNNRELRSFSLRTLACSILAFGGYLLMRTVLLPVEEYKAGTQLNPSNWLKNLSDFLSDILSLNISQELIFQAFITQNTYIILLCVTLIGAVVHRDSLIHFLLKRSFIVQITSAMIVLNTVSIATGIGNNMGRIAAILTPVMAGYISSIIVALDDRTSSCD